MPTGCRASWACISCPLVVPAVLGGVTRPGLLAEGRELPQLHTCMVPHWVATCTFLTSVTELSVCDQTSHRVLRVTCCLLRAWCNELPSDRAVSFSFSSFVAHEIETFSWRWFASSVVNILLGWRGTILVWGVLRGSVLAEAETRLLSIFKNWSFKYFFFSAVSSTSNCLNRIVWTLSFKCFSN